MFDPVPDATVPPWAALPPPEPGSPGTALPPEPGSPGTAPRSRVGRLTAAWRTMMVTTWVGVFVAYLAVWKASEELGIATWWLGPRSNPQPLAIRLVPFIVTAVFGILATYNVRRLPAIGLVGAVALIGVAVPDLTRSRGLATIEFAIAGAVLLVAAASFTGVYTEPRTHRGG